MPGLMHQLRPPFVSFLAFTIVAMSLQASSPQREDEQRAPLRSWNDGAAKKAIIDFVAKVTKEGSSDFVPPAERIAVFDNDGTLWCEQPMYFQLIFAMDRIKAMAPQHPEWKDKEPYKSVLAGDMKGLATTGQKGMMEIIAATHAGMTTEEFNALVKDWIKTARHPKFNRPYNECIYQPMLEVLDYLRANEFKTFIVSGGGVEFMRAFAEQTYGIPPERVVGSSGVVKFEMRSDGTPVLTKEAKVEFIDDGPGKPVGINRFIGRRPIMAFGNSDGDLQMLQWTTAPGSGARFALIVHHDDAQREVAYDRTSHIGKLDKALDEAQQRGWTVVSMKDDWSEVFPPTRGVAQKPETKPSKPTAGGLEDVKWRLTELNGQPALPGLNKRNAQITFNSKHRDIMANTGINSMGGRYTFEGQGLKISPGMMTRMAGPEPLMKQESEFVTMLESVTSYRIANGTLELLDGENVVAKFVAER